MGKFVNLVGSKFGKLSVISRTENEKVWEERYQRYQIYVNYLCKCECGKEVIRRSNTIKNKPKCFCGDKDCSKDYEDLSGQKFNKLMVLEYFGREQSGNILWKCLCECGNITTVRGYSLKAKRTMSCGCLHKEITSKNSRGRPPGNKLPPGESNFRNLYSRYKYSAKNRDISFELTEEQFRKLTKGNCFYCDKEPSTITITSKRGFTPYIYNGVDRINNEPYYREENTVSCCSTCNYLKQDSTLEEFKKEIKSVYEHLFKD